jgi:hypothetical protein
MFQQLMRTHGTLWAATRVTKEKLDVKFVTEEFMRTNGRRAMPLLNGAAAAHNLHHTHLAQLSDHMSWTESARAYAVRSQTPFTQRVASMGRMHETLPQVRASCTAQSLFLEHMSRIDGITTFEEEPSAVFDKDQ